MTHKCLKIWKLFSSCVLFFLYNEGNLLLFLVIFCLVSPSPFCENNKVHYVFTCKAPGCAVPAPAGGTAQKSTNHTSAITDQRGLLISLTAAPHFSHLQSVPSTLQNSLAVFSLQTTSILYVHYTCMDTNILSMIHMIHVLKTYSLLLLLLLLL